VRIGHTVKKLGIILALALLTTVTIAPAVTWARVEARYELISGDAIFGNDLFRQSNEQTLFHQQTLNTADMESINIEFPVSSGGAGIGPLQAMGGLAADGVSSGGSVSANVLPFGPVDLAFPDISETVVQSYGESTTGFYTANFLSIPVINNGGAPVIAGLYPANVPVSSSLSLAGSSMPFPEMVNIIPGYDETNYLSKSA
jgi:hypothetical protein